MSDERDRSKPLRYQLELRAGQTTARQVRGTEEISRPFRFEIWARVDRSDGMLTDGPHAGDPACLLLHREGEHLRRIRGIVTHASVEATAAGEPELHVVLEPRLVRARYRKDSRVFRNLSVPDLVRLVLERAGIPLVSRLSGSYRERPYCVQHQETDLDFVSRLLEEEGIFYFLRDDAQGGIGDAAEPPLLVLGDSTEAYEPIGGEPKLPFAAGQGLETSAEAIYELGERAKLAPAKVTLKDFSAARPSLDLTVSAPGPCEAGGDHYLYPGKYEVPAEGQRLAAIMAEAMACEAATVIGMSSCGRLIAGHVFDLEDGPAPAPEGRYVLTKLVHRWEREASVYSVELEALAGDTIFRPLRRTPRPIQASVLTGFVTGPEGQDIHCNEMGYVKVHFPWDREQPPTDNASHWIPVMQDNTGTSLGIPRVGWEVAVQHVDGDPDRPAILGRLYNGADPFPEPLPAGKTRTTLKSLSSPVNGGGGEGGAPTGLGLGPGVGGAGTVAANEILFEDAAGSELIYIQAQKDLNAVIAHDKTENVLHDELNEIDRDEVIEIGGNHDMIVGGDRSLSVHGSQKLTVDGDRRRKVGKSETVAIGGDRVTKIGSIHSRRIATTDKTATGSLNETVGALDLEASLKPNKISAGQVESLTVGGALIEAAAGKKQETVSTLRLETIGGLLLTSSLNEINVNVGTTRTSNVGGMWLTSAAKHVLYKSDTTHTQTIGASGLYLSPLALRVKISPQEKSESSSAEKTSESSSAEKTSESSSAEKKPQASSAEKKSADSSAEKKPLSSLSLEDKKISIVGKQLLIKADAIEFCNDQVQNNPETKGGHP